MKARKKIQNNKIPKAFAGALISTGLSLVSNLMGKDKIAEEERLARERTAALANSQNVLQDKVATQNYDTDGYGAVSYYKAGGNIDPNKKNKGKTTTTERPVTDKEAEANSYKNSPNSMFTADGIKMLGFVDETNTTKAPNIEFGKYKGLGYFETVSQDNGNRVKVSPTKNNIRNASDFKYNIKYLQELNPNLTIESSYVDTVNRKANGGNLSKSYKTKGGELKPLSSDMEVAKGNKHDESTIDNTSGIKLLDKTGKPFVEIEDEETIKDGTKVYSDQIIYKGNKTYAQTAEQLSKKKGELEKNINKGNSVQNTTARRKIQVIDKEEDALFAHQEASKVKQSSTMAEGGNLDWLKKGVESVVPYIDNITNAVLTNNAPKIPNPIVQAIPSLKTTVNVNPQLGAVNDAVEASNTFVGNNTSNSAVARNKVIATRLEGSRQKSAINANKENVETTLHNSNVQNAQQVIGNNLNVIRDNQNKQFARANDIQSRTSANIANAVGDFIDKKNFDSVEAYNNERLDIARQYDTNGTSLRADLLNPTEVNKLKTDDAYFNEQLERYKNSPRELERLKALRGL
jgi:hypothetical protein